MIATPPLVGRMAVRNQRDAIALEQAIRCHLWAWLETVDPFSRPNLRHPRVRAAEQRVRDAEYAEDWEGVEQGWSDFLSAVRSVTP